VRRKLTIFDVMILVAATALGIMALPPVHYLKQLIKRLGVIEPSKLLDPDYLYLVMLGGPGADETFVTDLVNLTLPYLLIGTPTVLVLRLLKPRPPWRSLVWQPGLWACGAATAAIIVAIVVALVFHGHVNLFVFPGAVGGAWLVLAVSRRWLSEPSWIDRLGRAIGVAWLSFLPIFGRWS
jgi:hypothetical protein